MGGGGDGEEGGYEKEYCSEDFVVLRICSCNK